VGEAKDLWMVEVTRRTLGGSVTGQYILDTSGTPEGALYSADACGKALELVCHSERWNDAPRPREVHVSVLKAMGSRKWMPVAQMSAFLGENDYADYTGKVIGRPDPNVRMYRRTDPF
jgi:hypothetical protein